jgi:16S rRNA (uracil1498-N3)-methyltransferase
MHERRIYIPNEPCTGETVPLTGDEAHYLLRVLRLREGAEVTAFNGRGWTGRALVSGAGKGTAQLRIVESRHAGPAARVFSIAQAVLKAPAMDMVVHCCTELGAGRVIGFHAERSVPRRSASHDEKRLARWRRIALEACRQSRRDFLPDISLLASPDGLAPLIAEAGGAFVASLREGVRPLVEHLSGGTFAGKGHLLLVVGPEGDFTGGELDRLIARGAVPCSLSDAVLRAGTASVASAALIGQHIISRNKRGVM